MVNSVHQQPLGKSATNLVERVMSEVPRCDEIWDRAADVLAMAAPQDSRAGENVTTEALITALHSFAQALHKDGASGHAGDVALFVLEVEPCHGPIHEAVARLALDIARDSGEIHLIALCRGKLAAAVVRAADTDDERRLEAFDLCESSIEHFLRAPKQYHPLLAQILGPLIDARPYLRKLLVPLFTLMPDSHCPAEIRSVLNGRQWPERVTAQSQEDWLEGVPDRIVALGWDEEIDRDRLALERMAASGHAMADWTDWTVDHPAYRRAVPHGRSIFREADFDRNFLGLSHELTHVFTFVGGLGMALSCLRAAALHTEWWLWARRPDVEAAEMAEKIFASGVAPIEPGVLDAMPHAERSLELTLKTQALQDAWTPWCEGLALFGELSADPALDPDCIGPMQHALRDLIDFSSSSPTAEALEHTFAEIEEFIAEFDKRCSAAIEASGRDRLRIYLDTRQVPYLAGYLAVRTVVSSWRRTCGRPLSATQAFNLLLHATRFGVLPAIPDLSLRSDQFEAESVRMMSVWVRELALLPEEDIDLFFQPTARDAAGTLFRWNGMRLMATSGEREGEEESVLFSERARQALTSLTRDDDLDRVPAASDGTPDIIGRYTQATKDEIRVESCANLARQMLHLKSMLPIGRTQGKFYLNVNSAKQNGYLGIQFRTTEMSVKNGVSSVNSAWFTIPRESAELIRTRYLDTADPRMEVTRVIDLGNIAFPGVRLPSPHLIIFKYGNWLHVQGASQATELLLERDPALRVHAAEVVASRLYPTGMIAAETRFIARGERMAERTRDWIDRSSQWGDDSDATPWAMAVRDKAQRVLDGTHRRRLQREAGRELLGEIGLHHELVDTVVESDFSTLTQHLVEHRAQLIDTLFRTARYPVQDVSIASLASSLEDEGLELLAKGPFGWDIAPCELNNAKDK